MVIFQLAEETDVRHAAHECPRRREKRPARGDVLAGAPCAKQQKSTDDVVIKESRRVLPPGVPAANRLCQRSQNAEDDGEIATDRDKHVRKDAATYPPIRGSITTSPRRAQT